MIEFQGWPKTPRLFRPVIITEKIDGTNAAIVIQDAPYGIGAAEPTEHGLIVWSEELGKLVEIGAQSRKRVITPLADNFGFAAWVAKNADSLVRDLGIGRHFGEWWGSGVQRGYGLPKGKKLFSLFNVSRYGEAAYNGFETPGLRVVPTLYTHHTLDEMIIRRTLRELGTSGSLAAYREGVRFDNPEGLIIFHTASNSVFKFTFDDEPKGE